MGGRAIKNTHFYIISDGKPKKATTIQTKMKKSTVALMRLRFKTSLSLFVSSKTAKESPIPPRATFQSPHPKSDAMPKTIRERTIPLRTPSP